MFADVYTGRRVLVTGHTGFKGSWLCAWLNRLGAEITGYALAPPTDPSHYELLKLNMNSVIGDIRDEQLLARTIAEFKPEMVFHLAAQPLVRLSYQSPVETFAINAGGTINVLEACRHTPSIKSVVVVTSDKCYENFEDGRAYCETDPMGGYDPYSASKGCAELITASYRRSFLDKAGILTASARAGNVIGGGDWALDRLVPDLMRSAAQGRTEKIRSPYAIRPWQHVLESLSGYLLLGQQLYSGNTEAARAWNFGPDHQYVITVEQAAAALRKAWPAVSFLPDPPPNAPHEAHYLQLNSTMAIKKLDWGNVWNPEAAFAHTATWYRDFYTQKTLNTWQDLEQYCSDAKVEGLSWTA